MNIIKLVFLCLQLTSRFKVACWKTLLPRQAFSHRKCVTHFNHILPELCALGLRVPSELPWHKTMVLQWRKEEKAGANKGVAWQREQQWRLRWQMSCKLHQISHSFSDVYICMEATSQNHWFWIRSSSVCKACDREKWLCSLKVAQHKSGN